MMLKCIHKGGLTGALTAVRSLSQRSATVSIDTSMGDRIISLVVTT